MNQKFLNQKISLLALIVLLGLSACKGPDECEECNDSDYSSGVIVLNEGAFGNGNASLGHHDPISNEIELGIFSNNNNNLPLGDVLQSMTTIGNKGYLVINNSGKVEVVDRSTMVSEGTITGFSGPRFLVQVSSDKAYVSDWTSNSVKIIDLNTNTISGSIPVGAGPEEMVFLGNQVYVANVGGFGTDSTVMVIDAVNDQVVDTILVGKGPISMKIDVNGKIWLLCRGDYGDFNDPNDDIGGSLHRIDPTTNQIEASFNFQNFEHPTRLVMNGAEDEMYILNGQVLKMNIADGNLPASPIVSKWLYGLGIDPSNGQIYGADAGDFVSAGKVYIYDASGNLLDSLAAGVAPNGFNFN